MRKLRGKAIVVLLVTYVCMFFSFGGEVFADRKIHVGDIINIKITGDTYTDAELRAKFKDFEVLDLEKEENGYVITVRTFDIGNKTIELDGTEIQIEVYSALEDTDRVGIYEGDSSRDVEFETVFSYFFYVVLLIFIVLVAINIYRHLRREKAKNLSVLDKFQNAMREIRFEEIEAPTKMTALFKIYLEEKLQCTIMGKTSKEIIDEISRNRGLDPYMERISKWLEECDRMKYCKDIATSDEVVVLFSELYKLVQTMDYDKGVSER